jgi:hypothetical protein
MSPTFPKIDDPMTALTRANGTNEQHHIDHGRVIGLHANVQQFGAKADGVSDDAAAIQAAVDSGASHVFFPPGTYFLADGSSINLTHSSQHLFGPVKAETGAGVVVTSKNAYAFKAVSSGNLTGVMTEGINTSLRAGSISGGGLKARSNDYMAGWMVRDCVFTHSGDGVCTDPVVWLSGWIGSYMDRCIVSSGGGHGIHMDSSGFVCNQWAIRNCSVSSNSLADRTHAGLAVTNGGSMGLIETNDFESNRGLGVSVDGGGQSNTVSANWFENNYNTNVKIADNAAAHVQFNSFQEPHNPQEAGFRHILLTETQATRRNVHSVMNNFFFGPYNEPGGNPNVVLEIGTNVTNAVVGGNWGMGVDTTIWTGVGGTPKVIDNGTKTTWLPNDPSAGARPDIWEIPGWARALRIVTTRTAAASGGDILSPEAVFFASNSTGTNYIMVGSRGYPIFCTNSTLTSSDELALNSFAFYWDNAAGKIKARVRNSAGAYSTLDVTP